MLVPYISDLLHTALAQKECMAITVNFGMLECTANQIFTVFCQSCKAISPEFYNLLISNGMFEDRKPDRIFCVEQFFFFCFFY